MLPAVLAVGSVLYFHGLLPASVPSGDFPFHYNGYAHVLRHVKPDGDVDFSAIGRERHGGPCLGRGSEANEALRRAMAQIVQQALRLGVVAEAGKQQDVAGPADLLGSRRHGARAGQHLGFPRQHGAMGVVDDSPDGAGQPQASANAGGIGRQPGDDRQGCRGQKACRGSDRLTARNRLTVHIRFGHSNRSNTARPHRSYCRRPASHSGILRPIITCHI